VGGCAQGVLLNSTGASYKFAGGRKILKYLENDEYDQADQARAHRHRPDCQVNTIAHHNKGL